MEAENHIFKHNRIFRHYVFMNNPHWRNSGILTFLSKYYIVISDTLVGGSFLDVFFLLLAVILSERFERPRRKD